MKTVVISGGTDGMGRATALARLSRGDTVIAIGSNADKGRTLLAEAGAEERLRFIQADLSSVAETTRVIDEIKRHTRTVDALLLFANRQSPKRQETSEGLERTFALYYLSRYLLTRGLSSLLDASPHPVIVSVAGVGNTAGRISWDDLLYQPLLLRRSSHELWLRATSGAPRPLGPVPAAISHYVLGPGYVELDPTFAEDDWWEFLRRTSRTKY